MTKSDLHAFAVLAYKDSPYLEECILSLKNQTVKSNIYITTSTPSAFIEHIAEKYQTPILINREPGSGIASDWSFAYKHCESEYLTLAHQDDVYSPEYTESCLELSNSAGGKEDLIIFTGYNELTGKQIRAHGFHFFIKDILLSPFLFKQRISSLFLRRIILSFGNPIPCPTVMYHKSVIGEFEFLDDFRCNMDWDAWLRLANEKGAFVYVRPKLVVHRIHKDMQTLVQIRESVRQKEDRLIFERIWPRPVSQCLLNLYSLSIRFNER